MAASQQDNIETVAFYLMYFCSLLEALQEVMRGMFKYLSPEVNHPDIPPRPKALAHHSESFDPAAAETVTSSFTILLQYPTPSNQYQGRSGRVGGV